MVLFQGGNKGSPLTGFFTYLFGTSLSGKTSFLVSLCNIQFNTISHIVLSFPYIHT